jgi:hypothetical protein
METGYQLPLMWFQHATEGNWHVLIGQFEDRADLFRQTALNRLLPIVAVTVGIPLFEMNATYGTTALWPRSHRDEKLATTEIAEEPHVREGSCAIWGYRRAWFWDHKNYQQQAAVRAPKRLLADLPEDLRRLLTRAQEC